MSVALDHSGSQNSSVQASAVTVDGIAAASAAPARAGGMSTAAQRAAAALARRSLSPVIFAGAVRLAEFMTLVALGTLIYFVYVVPTDGFAWFYALPIIGGSLAAVFLIQTADGYTIPALRHGVLRLGRIALAWTGVFALFGAVAFLTKSGDSYSRVWISAWYVAGLVALGVLRPSISAFARRWTETGLLERRAIVVGGGQAAEELINALAAEPDNDIRICGIFDDRKDDRSPSVVAGYPKLGTVAELVDFGRIAHVDLLIVAMPLTAESRLLQMLKQLWVLPVDIRLSAHGNKLRFRPRSYSFIGTLPFLDVFDKPITDWNYLLKRAFDLAVGTLALLLLSPLMLATAVAIRLESRGPVFFRQKRYGFNNEVIDVWKFRSMYHEFADPLARKVVTKNDARVTRVGKFIRRTSIDELPQLFNVLRGDLSLVGPRPHAVNAHTSERLFEQVVDGYFARHRVRPGVTGWAQINGWRGEIDTPEKIRRRVEFDLDYIENWSVLFDVKILALTPFRLFDKTGAY
ncbi:MAG TPA: undecaprenyl-phosphate glucose phosphotransferase [Bauldia sp.]|nr:undecaprenyl-phosphate glucose phosphotransferase [Bauldia sp.]